MGNEGSLELFSVILVSKPWPLFSPWGLLEWGSINVCFFWYSSFKFPTGQNLKRQSGGSYADFLLKDTQKFGCLALELKKKKRHRETSDTSLSNLLTLFLYSWEWGGGQILTWYIQTLHHLESFNQLLWQDQGEAGNMWMLVKWSNLKELDAVIEVLRWGTRDPGEPSLQHPLLVIGWGFWADHSICLILFPQGDLAYPNAVITL